MNGEMLKENCWLSTEYTVILSATKVNGCVELGFSKKCDEGHWLCFFHDQLQSTSYFAVFLAVLF